MPFAMIYNGIYSWDGKKVDDREPISWFPGSCGLKIVDLRSGNRGITLLKPYLCIFSQSSSGHSISVNPEKFARRICADFSLQMEKVLWVEELDSDAGRYQVFSFARGVTMGEKALYTYKCRPPLAGELDLISQLGGG